MSVIYVFNLAYQFSPSPEPLPGTPCEGQLDPWIQAVFQNQLTENSYQRKIRKWCKKAKFHILYQACEIFHQDLWQVHILQTTGKWYKSKWNEPVNFKIIYSYLMPLVFRIVPHLPNQYLSCAILCLVSDVQFSASSPSPVLALPPSSNTLSYPNPYLLLFTVQAHMQ